MTELSPLAFAAFIGFIAGLVFFGGLWFTTQRFSTWNNPAIWLLLSFLARASVVLGAIYWVGRDHLPRIAACLVGFLIARTAMLLMTRKRKQSADDDGENRPCV